MPAILSSARIQQQVSSVWQPNLRSFWAFLGCRAVRGRLSGSDQPSFIADSTCYMRCMPCACNCATLTSSHEKRLNASLNKPGVAALAGDSADVRLKAPTCSTVAWDLVHPYRGLILMGGQGMSFITAGSNMARPIPAGTRA